MKGRAPRHGDGPARIGVVFVNCFGGRFVQYTTTAHQPVFVRRVSPFGHAY